MLDMAYSLVQIPTVIYYSILGEKLYREGSSPSVSIQNCAKKKDARELVWRGIMPREHLGRQLCELPTLNFDGGK